MFSSSCNACFMSRYTVCASHFGMVLLNLTTAMVTNHLRAPYGVYFTKIVFYQFLDIVMCPVKFRYNIKFLGARTAFGRVNEDKMASAGVCTHRTGTGRFLFKIYIVRFQQCIVRCLTSAGNFQISQIGRCPSRHRPMCYKTNCHR